MGTLNNRRLYAAALGIAAVGFVLDRTVFSDSGSGPEAAKAELTPQARTAAPAPRHSPQPERAAVLALVEKLKTIEQASPVGPPSRPDAFALCRSDTEDASKPAADEPADNGPASEFKKNHTLRMVLTAREGDTEPLVVVDKSSYRIGETIDGFRLESIRRPDMGKPAGATFVSGDIRVELIVPTSSGRPKSGGNGAPDSPPGS